MVSVGTVLAVHGTVDVNGTTHLECLSLGRQSFVKLADEVSNNLVESLPLLSAK